VRSMSRRRRLPFSDVARRRCTSADSCWTRSLQAGDLGLETDELAHHLAAHRPGAGSADLVFTSPEGGPLRRYFAERVFNPAVKCAGLDRGPTFHGLRHVAASPHGRAGRASPGDPRAAWARHRPALHGAVRTRTRSRRPRRRKSSRRALEGIYSGHGSGTTTARRAPPTNKRPGRNEWR
jgi:hypothetical protein